MSYWCWPEAAFRRPHRRAAAPAAQVVEDLLLRYAPVDAVHQFQVAAAGPVGVAQEAQELRRLAQVAEIDEGRDV